MSGFITVFAYVNYTTVSRIVSFYFFFKIDYFFLVLR